jgi:hypothetical protein
VRIKFLASAMLGLVCTPTEACQLATLTRELTIAEQVAGLDEMFAGTVIGYVTEDGTRLMGSIPPQCLDDDGNYPWWTEMVLPECLVYLDTVEALFHVDVAIVGPAVNEIATYGMHWGDGDCDIDFDVGDKWLVAGFWYTQELKAPVREDEVALLRRLASRPAFDIRQLYP